ncbi:MAG TPA: cell division protein FtsW, partial [Piscinibacter sp.]|nr:cell division protein FtsW [Piscinibacter sp.]
MKAFDRLRAWIAERRGPLELPVRDTLRSAPPPTLLSFDRSLVLVALALLTFGLVMVYSASIAI